MKFDALILQNQTCLSNRLVPFQINQVQNKNQKIVIV